MRTYEPARRTTGGIFGDAYYQVHRYEIDDITDNSATTVEAPNPEQHEEMDKNLGRGKRLRLCDTINTKPLTNKSKVKLTNSSCQDPPVKSCKTENPSTSSNVETRDAKESGTLLGLLQAKNEEIRVKAEETQAKNKEIQMLTNMLMENKAKWSAEEERLNKEITELKRLLEEKSFQNEGLKEKITLITQICTEGSDPVTFRKSD